MRLIVFQVLILLKSTIFPSTFSNSFPSVNLTKEYHLSFHFFHLIYEQFNNLLCSVNCHVCQPVMVWKCQRVYTVTIILIFQSNSHLSHYHCLHLHYQTEHSNLLRHSSLTPIYLYMHKMNFDVVRAWNSYPHHKARHNVQ